MWPVTAAISSRSPRPPPRLPPSPFAAREPNSDSDWLGRIGRATSCQIPLAERAAELGDQEGKAPRGGRGHAGVKFRVQRDVNVDWIAVLVFRLPEPYSTISDVLRSKPHCIFPPSPRVEQQVKSQPGFAAERVPLTILRDFFRRP